MKDELLNLNHSEKANLAYKAKEILRCKIELESVKNDKLKLLIEELEANRGKSLNHFSEKDVENSIADLYEFLFDQIKHSTLSALKARDFLISLSGEKLLKTKRKHSYSQGRQYSRRRRISVVPDEIVTITYEIDSKRRKFSRSQKKRYHVTGKVKAISNAGLIIEEAFGSRRTVRRKAIVDITRHSGRSSKKSNLKSKEVKDTK